ncbi:MAG TPA: hypothetical protein V6C81_31290 [Planktothrix sp.]|jgi:hypothetical protein
MTGSTTLANKPLPLWSRALITLVVLVFAALFAGGISTIYGIDRLGKLMNDPAYVAGAAHDIAQFPAPLPHGYHYLVGLSLPALGAEGIAAVTVEHDPDKQLTTFICVGSDASESEDVQDLLERGYSVGPFMLNTCAKFVTLKQKSKMTVAGHEMSYIIGDTVNKLTDEKGQGMVGCMQIPQKGGRKNILIYALQNSNVTYNQQITLNLLNSIKSF